MYKEFNTYKINFIWILINYILELFIKINFKYYYT